MKKFWLSLGLVLLLVGAGLAFRYLPSTSGFLWGLSRQGAFLLPLVTVAALVDSINPCAISILILTIAFLLSLGAIKSRIVGIGGAYIAGLYLVYLLIGLGILQALHLFNTPHFMARLGAVLLVGLGVLHLVGISIKLPAATHRPIAGLMHRGTLVGAFLLGGLVGVCEFPCTGGPYLMVLGLLHDQGTYLRGLGYLIYYNLIFVLPLVAILAVAGTATTLERIQEFTKTHHRATRILTGLALIGLGLVTLAL